MAQNREQNREQNIVVTPAGVAKFPRLNTPDTKFNQAGHYKVTLVLDESDDGVEEFLQTIRDIEAKAVADAQKAAKNGKRVKEAETIIKPVLDEDGNEVEGKVEVTAKMLASGVRKDGSQWERKPVLFDANGRPSHAKVGGGSILKLSVDAQPYYTTLLGAGCTLRLEGVQIIELKEFSGGRTADALGFGKEDGYSASDEGEDSDAGGSDDDDSDEGDDTDGADEEEADDKPTKAKAKGAKPAKPGKGKPAPKAGKKARRDF